MSMCFAKVGSSWRMLSLRETAVRTLSTKTIIVCVFEEGGVDTVKSLIQVVDKQLSFLVELDWLVIVCGDVLEGRERTRQLTHQCRSTGLLH